jgi:predicted nucleic acid-binding protein
VEFDSAIWKKVRTGELMIEEARSLIDSFELDYDKYDFIKLDSEIVRDSKNLISKHGTKGLRTLDSIQLSSALRLKSELGFFVTSDDLLKHLAEMEELIIL